MWLSFIYNKALVLKPLPTNFHSLFEFSIILLPNCKIIQISNGCILWHQSKYLLLLNLLCLPLHSLISLSSVISQNLAPKSPNANYDEIFFVNSGEEFNYESGTFFILFCIDLLRFNEELKERRQSYSGTLKIPQEGNLAT